MILRRLYWTAYLAWHLRGQARYAFPPIEAIRRDRDHKVRSLVAYAGAHVPYYRETLGRLGLAPSDFATADDLAKLPILDREAFRRDPEYFVSDQVRPDRCVPLCSGGSTGLPVTVFYTPALALQCIAQGERLRSIVGAVVGLRRRRETTLITPKGTDAKLREFWRSALLAPRRLRAPSQRLSVHDPLEVSAPLVDAFQPDVIYTYGSVLEMLFPVAQPAGLLRHLPKAVVYGADDLPEPSRRHIADDLGIPIFSSYQATEAYLIGFECEQHRGLHLNADLYPVRIVDGADHTAPPGQRGEVIVSNLASRGTVLLNYRLGDLATALPDACPCGRSLPLLSFPQGRKNDLIVAPSGQVFHPFTVTALIRVEAGIARYQAIQVSPSSFRVLLVVTPSCDRAAVRARLADRFRATFGAEVAVDVQFVDSIDRTAAGKFRSVMSLVPRPPHGGGRLGHLPALWRDARMPLKQQEVRR